MRTRIGWLLLAVGLTLGAPAGGRAQDSSYTYEVPPVPFTGPLSHPRYEDGGFYTGVQFLYLRQTRPIYDQTVAVRGILDIDGSITGTTGTFVGSREDALNVEQVRGPGTYEPGFNLFFGWRFESGVVAELSWWHLRDARYAATAAPIGLTANFGDLLQNTYLFSPVSNFPIDFAGNPQNLAVGNPGATFGIWNGASLMQIEFLQRFDMVQLNTRIPIQQTDRYRSYGLIGPRAVVMWERFKWRTVDYDFLGLTTADSTAIYSNVVSNRMYGVHLGCGNDWFLGDTPVGAFAITADFETGLYLDLVKGRPRYELGDRSMTLSRARNLNTLVPSLEARFSLDWYPWEAIKFNVGYNFLAFFNTVASRRPIDFNMGTIDPEYNTGVTRWLHGFTMGVSLVF